MAYMIVTEKHLEYAGNLGYNTQQIVAPNRVIGLSGEYADDPTPDSLALMLALDPSAISGEDMDAICQAFEDGAADYIGELG